MHIPRLCIWGESYRLWCTKLKSPWLIISRDVRFNKSALIDQSKESIEAVKDQGVNKQVELDVEALDEVHDSTSIQPIPDEV